MKTVVYFNVLTDARLIKYCGRRLLGHENFHVTLATGLPNPHFSPRIASNTMLLNYNASPETMREELLDRAFVRVTPQLHAERRKVLAALQQHRNTVQVSVACIKKNIFIALLFPMHATI